MPPRPDTNCTAQHRHDPDRPRRAADGLNLCQGCLGGIRRQLAELPTLYQEVVASMPNQRTTTGLPVTGSREHALPVNLAAGELRRQIEYDLYAISMWVASDRGMNLPADGRVVTVCAWLERHVDWLAASMYAAEVRGVLIELTGLAHRVIDPDRPALVLGQCVEVPDGEPCDGVLRATVLDADDPRPFRMWCDSCGKEWTAQELYRFGAHYHTRLTEIEKAKRERMTA